MKCVQRGKEPHGLCEDQSESGSRTFSQTGSGQPLRGWSLPSPAFSLQTCSERSLLPSLPFCTLQWSPWLPRLGKGVGLLLTRDKQAETPAQLTIPGDSPLIPIRWRLHVPRSPPPPYTVRSPLCRLGDLPKVPPSRAALCRCYLDSVPRPPARPAHALGMPRSA